VSASSRQQRVPREFPSLCPAVVGADRPEVWIEMTANHRDGDPGCTGLPSAIAADRGLPPIVHVSLINMTADAVVCASPGHDPGRWSPVTESNRRPSPYHA